MAEAQAQPLSALVVDDEAPALSELAYLLARDERIGEVRTATSAQHALKALESGGIDVVFCDIKMPGLDGLDLARVLARFSHSPQVVFVTAYDEHAVDAFDLRATDYVMKPVRAERLSEAVRRVVDAAHGGHEQSGDDADETIAIELGGVTRFVQRSQVLWVEAQGDYARLHTQDESHLLRVPLSTLETRWAAAGFARIHRSTLVSLPHIDEVRTDAGRCVVRLGAASAPDGGVELVVSRRHTRELRDRLIRAASPQRSRRADLKPAEEPAEEQVGEPQAGEP